MKTFKIAFSALIMLTVLFFFSCSDNDMLNTKQNAPEKMGLSGEKYDALLANHPEEQLSPRAPISYIANFCTDVVWVDTHATTNSIINSAYWDYYTFYANESSTLNIRVNRLTCEMDPGFALYSGIYTNTDDLLTPITFRDDQCSPACVTCFAWGDPCYNGWNVPASGYYTLAVFDVASCGSAPFAYELVISGNTSTIVLDCCDSGVENYVFDDGDTMMGYIMACAEDALNHGEFVSCVAHLTNEWKKEGLITGYEKDLIMSCAGEANIP